MKLFLRAALNGRKHFFILACTVVSLIGITLANQMEALTFGILSRTQSDVVQKDLGDIKSETTKWGSTPYVGTVFRPISRLMKKYLHFGNNLKAFILLFFLVTGFKACFLFLSSYTSQILFIRVSRDLRERFFEHIQCLPMSFYQKYNIGTLSSRVATDANHIAAALGSLVTNYVRVPFTICTTLVLCFCISWPLSLIVFLCAPLIALPVTLITRKVKKSFRQLQRNQEMFQSIVIDFLSGIQTIKIFAMEAFSRKKYREKNNRMAKLEATTAKYDLITRPVVHTITMSCLATVLIIGLHVLNMAVGELIAFAALLHLFYGPVKKFSEENANIQKGVVAAQRLFEVLSIKPQIQDLPSAIELRSFNKGIEFDKVWFRYKEKWILKDLSFHVQKGETVAIVGMTGVGKSTIVQLIPRLYDVQSGEIRFDGKPLQSYTQKSLREQIAFVPQATVLFCDTIAANIAYGRPLPRRAIIAAAKKAHAHEFISQMPNTYDTVLAETGNIFSGGQQQRLAIARALAKNAPILILDEATSSLDPLSESKIKAAIKTLHGQVTQILIAHRLSTIEYADRIIYLEKGRKLAEGTKEKLFDTCPEFCAMWKMHSHFKVSG